MPDYSQGKIQKLTGNGLVQIGQTTQELRTRLMRHRSEARLKRKNITSRRLFEGEEEVEIELLERCSTKEEMNERER